MNAPALCQCGCGKHVAIAKYTDRSKGWVKGVPLKYLRGHNTTSNGLAQTARAIGNRQITSHGYVRVMVSKGVRQYEHILIAEKALGRPLRKFGRSHPDTEVVHHINGNKQDNRNENLLVCSHAYHTELHHRLEASPAWPEFPRVTRNQGAHHA